MAVVVQSTTQHIATLSSTTLLGRSRANHIVLESREASASHACIQYLGDEWTIRDLNSRNGTFVDGRRIRIDERVVLTPSSRLAFGDCKSTWHIMDLGPPLATFVCLTGLRTAVVEEQGSILLEGSEPLISAFCVGGKLWRLVEGSHERTLADGDVILANGTKWRFCAPASDLPCTVEVSRCGGIAEACLRFVPSADQEDVRLDLVRDDGQISLGARASYYVLLELARIRLRDDDPYGEEAGWVPPEMLASALSIDVTHLNVHVHRIRKAFAQAGLQDAFNIIQRRPGSGKMRIGSAKIQIDSAS